MEEKLRYTCILCVRTSVSDHGGGRRRKRGENRACYFHLELYKYSEKSQTSSVSGKRHLILQKCLDLCNLKAVFYCFNQWSFFYFITFFIFTRENQEMHTVCSPHQPATWDFHLLIPSKPFLHDKYSTTELPQCYLRWSWSGNSRWFQLIF